MKQEKEFDRSICFTFYNEFHEQIMDVKRDFGLEQAFEVYEAIVNYGLYGIEIQKGRLRTLVGNSTIAKVENSQENRARWFNGENFEQTKVVAEYMRDHPEASQRIIATATGVGKTKVGKVQKSIRESGFDNIQDYLNNVVYPNLTDTNNDSNNDNDSNNYIVGETETDQRDQSDQSDTHTGSASPPMESSTPTTTEVELSEDEIYTRQVSVIKLFRNRKKLKDIVDETGFEFSFVNDTIDWYMENGRKYPQKPKCMKVLDIALKDGTKYWQTKQEIFDSITNNGELLVDEINWQWVKENLEKDGIPTQQVTKLIKEFKQRLREINNVTVLQRIAN